MTRFTCIFIREQTDCMLGNVKLALFFDWMFHNPKVDNIMNIGKLRLFQH